MKRPQAMATDSKSSLTPKLRFPEFRDAPEWKVEPLALFLEEVSERVPSGTDLPIYSSTRTGLKRQDDYYDGKILLNKNDYGVVPVGCFVYRHMSGDGLFKFNINDTGGDIAVSKEYPVFRTVNLDPKFLLSKLNYGADFEEFAMSQKAGGTRTRLYFSKLSAWETSIPSLAEQKKIAECLSTLDELIGAESQKLDALKAHKKGLMQQLFPRQGETIPRFRFPEFQDAPEWDAVPLGGLLSRNPEYGVNAPAAPYSESLPTYLRITDIDDDGRFLSESKASVDIVPTEESYLSDGDIVLARTGASVGKSYRYRPKDGRLVFAGFLIRIRPSPAKIDTVFLANFLTTNQYWEWVKITSTRSGQPGLNGPEYASLLIPLPPPGQIGVAEQKRIASCLSSLDELIAAQGDQLEALKTHKKGLMQQLFPSPADAEA
jgi:type I restriction enzyme S subunit